MRNQVEKALVKAGAWLDKINKAITYLLLAVLFLALASVIYGIVTRYFFNKPAIWVEEMNTYFLVLFCFLPLAWVLSQGRHVRVDILLGAVSESKRNIINFIAMLLGLISSVILLWITGKRAGEVLLAGAVLDSMLAPPAFPILVIIPIGILLLLLQFIRETAHYISLVRSKPQSPTSEVIS